LHLIFWRRAIQNKLYMTASAVAAAVDAKEL